MPQDSPSIPARLQVDPQNCAFDLEAALQSVVSVRTRIPKSALTASVLGTERDGHGVLIGDDGLVLTIGYVVTEAESVWLVDNSGTTVQGYVVGYDQESGFGLVRALGVVGGAALQLGDSNSLQKGCNMILAGAGGVAASMQVSLVSIREFAGHWEYLLDKAFFTAPAHPSWSGAALLGVDGKLYGIGSLIMQTEDQQGNQGAANMVIPINELTAIIDDLINYGKRSREARPWMGWYVQETRAGLLVQGVIDDGPAEVAGIEPGDLILEVDGVSAPTLPDMYRSIWSAGAAGTTFHIAFERNSQRYSEWVESVDRSEMLVRSSMH